MVDKISIQKNLNAKYVEMKRLEKEVLKLRRQLADPEKSKKLKELAQILYIKILEANVSDDLNPKQLISSVLDSLNQEDLVFFHDHKYDSFSSSIQLFKLNLENPIQKRLIKDRYINQITLKKQKTIQQVIKYLAGAKVQQHKDKLLKELKDLKTKESLRYSLFQQEGFKEITDFNERECLLMLKSYPELKDKEMIAKLNISRSKWYRYKNKFSELNLI